MLVNCNGPQGRKGLGFPSRAADLDCQGQRESIKGDA